MSDLWQAYSLNKSTLYQKADNRIGSLNIDKINKKVNLFKKANKTIEKIL